MDKIILKDNTTIEATSITSIGNIKTTVADVTALQELKDNLSSDNLELVKVLNDAGLTVAEYKELVLNPVMEIEWIEGGISARVSLREKDELEKRMDAVEDGQKVQDGAIADLGSAVSDIAEGV